MKKLFFLFVLTVLSVASPINSLSQILTFEFNGLAGSELTASSNSNDPNLGASTISRGSGLTASGNGNRFNATNWATTSIANAVSGNDYMEFTITPNAGYGFAVTSIAVNFQRSSTGTRELALRSSVDGYSSNIGTNFTITDNTSVQTHTFTVAQSTSSSAVTYRFYGWAESTGGSGGFEGTGDDIVVNGTVVSTGGSPAISVSPSSLTGFSTTSGTPSASQSYTLSGSNLSPASGNITVTAPTDFEVSLDNSSFSASVNVAYTGGTLSSTTVYTRIASTASAGAPSGNISNAGGGATAQTVAVDGSVTAPCNSLLAQSWEGSGWGYTSNKGDATNGYDLSGNYSDDVWTFGTDAQMQGSLSPTDGNNFWGFEDIDNGSYAGQHTLTFDEYDVSGASNMFITFDWATFDYNATDNVGYQVILDGTPQTAVTLCSGCGNASGSELISIANGTSELAFILFAEQNGNTQYGMFDNVNLCGTGSVTLPATPSLSASVSALSGFQTTSGTASASQNFDLTGSNLTPASGNLTVAAPAGFEVSTNNSTFSASVNVAYSGGSASQTIYVRIASTASAGNPSGNVTCSGGGATSTDVAVDGTVCPAPSGNFNVGDISIVGYSTDAPDAFAFVNWVAIPNGATLFFTDNAYENGALATNENTVEWNNNTGNAIPVGTVIVYTDGSGFDLGTDASGNINGLSASQDNLFIYEGSASCPEFVFGFSNNPWVTSGSASNNDSYLPATLNVANGNLNVTSEDNWQYSAPRNNQATIAAYKPLVNNTSNWTGDNNPFTLSSTDFIIASANPSVELSASAGSGSEAATSSITITATASAAVSGDQTIQLNISGAGITAGDYTITNSGIITILDGQTTGTATFTIVDDAAVEGNETATIGYNAGSISSGLTLGTVTTLDIDIADNDGSVLYSQASGGTNAAIWDIVPSGTGQLATAFGGFSEFVDVVVQSGHTVDITVSGPDMKSLTVQAGGKIYANNGTSPEYIDIFGNVVNNGIIGNGSTLDLISFNLKGTDPITFSGNGSYDIGRMRKDAGATGTITINANMNLRFNGAVIYNNNTSSSFDLTIAAGKTINVLDAAGDVSIDGVDGAAGSERGGSITVNGTLNIANKLYAISNNSSLPCSMSIGSAGRIVAKDVDLNIDGTGFTGFTIASGGSLEINGVLAVKGGTLNSNGGVIINSGATLLHGAGTTNGGGSITGNVTVRRQGTTNSTVYNYWSSPVQSGTVPGSSVYEYDSDNSTQDYSDDQNPDPGWEPFSGIMTVGKGYASRGGGLASFVGTVNNGSIPYSLDYHPYSPGNTNPGTPFNLVGNPYPGAISASTFVGANGNINGSLYFWDDDLSGGSGYSYTDYAVWNGTGSIGTGAGTTPPNGYIASGQGFLVMALNGGNINFTNSMRVSGPNNLFFKPNADESKLWLSIEGNGLYNEILIGMLEDATDQEDRLYDAVKVRGNSSVSMSAVLADRDYAIMAFPPPFVGKTVPLALTLGESGSFTFNAHTMQGFDGYEVFFEDAVEQQTVQLTEETEIEVALASGEYTNRFFLHFVQVAEPNGVQSMDETALNAFVNMDNLFISSNREILNATVDIVSAEGRLVYSKSGCALQSSSPLSVPIDQYAAGVYIVRLSSRDGILTQRFVKP